VVEEYAPGFTKSVVHEDILFPPDLERIFGITGGNISMERSRLIIYSLADLCLGILITLLHIRTCLCCGSGTHPGGGVMGAPGRLCA